MTSAKIPPARSATIIVARIAAALPGNHAATTAVGSLLAILLARSGMTRSDAVVLASIVAIPGYLVVLLWAFHTPRLWRFWSGLVVVAGTATMASRLLGPALP